MLHAIKYVEELEKAGFTNEQAKKSVKVWMEFMDNQFASKSDLKELHYLMKSDLKELHYVMKSDLNELESNMKTEFARVDNEMKAGFARVDNEMKVGFARVDNEMKVGFARVDIKFLELENRLLIKLGGMIVASVAILATFITLTK